MAKYPYIVVKNNIWYSAGAEVPVDMPTVENESEVPVDMPVEEIESDVTDEESVEEKKVTRGRKKQV